jgi:NADP-dependent 3-hydroxy acid dehydrogenase YdfG
MDTQSKASSKAAAKGMQGPIDCVILNAGTMLWGNTATEPTDEGYGTMFAMHVLGRDPLPATLRLV